MNEQQMEKKEEKAMLWADTEGTNSSKILCPTFVYVLFYVNLCHDWFCGLLIICGLMTCVQSKLEPDWTLFLAMM